MEMRAQALRLGHGNLAAGVERGRPAADGHQRGLGHDLHQVVLPQGVEHAEERAGAADDAEGEGRTAGGAGDGADSVGRSGADAGGSVVLACRSSPLAPDVTMLPPVILAQSNPSCRSLVRDTSITFTCSSTCWQPPTVMLLITFG